METIDVKQLLELHFKDKFDFHPEFIIEFNQLINRTGSERKIATQLVARLNAIIELGNIDYGKKWLEHLKGEDSLYSLHIDADSKNYRLLFTKIKNGKYFLHAFYEREGKKSTSYDKHIEIAKKRIND